MNALEGTGPRPAADGGPLPGRSAAAPHTGQAFEAVVLAGGRARRAGGIDKPAALVGGQTIAGAVVSAAASAGAVRAIVVGPDRPGLLAGARAPRGGVRFVREEPAGSGPVPAVVRGLTEVRADLVAVLAGDTPFLRAEHLRVLVDAAAAGAGAIAVDDGGREQWLIGCWQTARLRAAAAGYAGTSLGGLLGQLAPVAVRYDLAPGEPPPWLDCDTAEDLARARRWQARARPAGKAGPGRPSGGTADRRT